MPNVNRVNSKNTPEITKIVNFHEKFNYADIEPEYYNRLDIDETTELLKNIFLKLIRRCLFLGLDVRHAKKKSMGDFVLEAHFEPPNKTKNLEAGVYIPIVGVSDLVAKNLSCSKENLDKELGYFVDQALRQHDNDGLIRLIVVTAHELGHFISYCNGNHDKLLAEGISLMHQGDVIGNDKLTTLVFVEEVIAWGHAQNHLERYGFIWWEVLKKIKLNSLEAYYKLLQLHRATVSNFARLSMIDEFRVVSKSSYF